MRPPRFTLCQRATGLAATAVLLLATTPAMAANEAATIAALQAQLRVLTERLEQLENRHEAAEVVIATYQAPQVRNAPAPASWTDSITLKGDMRYRHEAFDNENANVRQRQRIRARAALEAQVDENVQVGFGLASGDGNPSSTNQSLDTGFSSKSVVLDLAYASWDTPIDGLAVSAGKIKNPLHRAGGYGLIWDGDVNPEGLGVTWQHDNWFANGLGAWVEESSGGDDAFLVGGQLGWAAQLDERSSTRLGVGYYNYINSQGMQPFFDGSPRGNRVDANGNYLTGFELVEAFAEYNVDTPVGALALFADVVHNTEADNFETAYAIGASLKRNDWSFSYTWQDVGADAVVGVFTDSDYLGAQSDGRGHTLTTGYALTQRINLKSTLFLTERNVDVGPTQDFRRLMLDVSFKY